jgi:methionyl-tRNA formyltransferase
MATALAIRIIVLGTGDFALPMFDHLCDTGHQVVALLTQPDRPQGRKQELIPSQIKQSALARGIALLQPENVNAQESLEQIRQLGPDLIVTASYGQILSPDLLAIPTLGGINLHGSILPAYRGAAPVARAIQHGETETGVTVIRITPRIGADETAGELEHRLAVLGAPLIAQAVADIAANTARITNQDRSKVTRAPKLTKEDGFIDWSLPALAIHNLVRAMQPWPLCSTTWISRDPSSKGPLRVIIHQTRPVESPEQGPPGTVVEARTDRLIVAAGAAAVRLLLLQLPGKKPVSAADFLHGHRVLPGDSMKS